MIITKEQKEQISRAFSQYAEGYDMTDPKIRLKAEHTYKVAALAQRIAEAVDPENAGMAWLSGMLHDIGRFEQVRRYHTFIDADSVNHAEFGANLLFQDHLIDMLLKGFTLSDSDLRLLERSIRCHNMYRLPEGLSDRETSSCQILRDADKIDILRVIGDTPLEDIYGLSTEKLRTAPVSEEVKSCFCKKTSVLRSLKRTPIDHLVGHICLIFDLAYPVSREIIAEQGYLLRLLSFPSDNPDTRAWFEYMRSHITL